MRVCSANATKIITGNCNITPNLAPNNSNDILSGSTNARDRIDKSILIDKTEESNDEENSEAVDISTELSKYRVKTRIRLFLRLLT